MKRLKHLLSIVIILILCFIINEFFHYILIDDRQSYTRIMMHELYESENIDTLFLGSSHCFHSLNPALASSITGKNTFNAGSSMQALDASYALLVEADKTNDLEQVYVELYYGITSEDYSLRNDMTGIYLISDYMKHSLNRTLFLLNASSNEHYINSFILGRRNNDKLLDFAWIMENVTYKRTRAYRDYNYTSGIGESYMGNGFVSSTIGMDVHGVYADYIDTPISDNHILDDSKKYIDKIIKYCKKNDIEVTFFTAPMNDLMLSQIDYDNYVTQVNAILSSYDVNYYDFNLINPGILTLSGEDFMDLGHLNGVGANKFTTVFSNIISGNLDANIAFLSSYSDRLQMLDNNILGLILLEDNSDNEEFRQWSIDTVFARETLPMEYEIIISSDNYGEIPYEYSDNNMITVFATDSGLISVYARIQGETEYVAKAIMKYE